MSKRAKYIAEREGKETYENEYLFIEYLYTKERNELFITDVYVEPQFRGTGVLREAYNKITEIAKERNCDYIMATVDKETNGWKKSKSILENENFKNDFKHENLLYYIKEINYGK